MPSRRSVRITRTAISPRLATRTVENTLTTPASNAGGVAGTAGDAFDSAWGALHPEDAVGDRLQRRVGGGGQGEPEHVAGVPGVDDPVVPQPRGRVVRVALVLVLGPDRCLELLFRFRAPLLPARLCLVPPDGREHVGRLVAAHHRDAGVGP